MPTPLAAALLRRRCDPAGFAFQDTAGLPELTELPGQERALSALRFAVGLRAHDYNVFAVGSAGLGKHAAVRALLEAQAAGEPTPDDWCYVNDFAERHTPRALRLPAGRGVELRRSLETLLSDVRAALRAVMEGEELRAQAKALAEATAHKHEEAMRELERDAAEHGVVLVREDESITLVPAREGRPMSREEFLQLPPDEKARLTGEMEALHRRVDEVIGKVAKLALEARRGYRALVEQAARKVVQQVLEDVRRRFADLPQVVSFLEAVEADLVARTSELTAAPEREEGGLEAEVPLARRYRVNVLTDHSGARGAPVVYEDNPTYANLFGRVEHLQVLGALLTDFNLIKPGALHRANGGYLVLDALKLLQQPFCWEALKRCLLGKQLRIQNPAEALGLSSTVALEPRPIPLEVKVVLVGDRAVHDLLGRYDPEFRELWKVQADFAPDLEWTPAAEPVYARLLGAIARREKTRPLSPGAVARLVEEAARWADDRRRLSLDLQGLSDLVREADRAAGSAGGEGLVLAGHVERALAERRHRADRPREELLDQIARGVLLVDLQGEAVGQLNGIALVGAAGQAFGRPVRITARARLGKDQVLDVEREVELGGPIHTKGVLILSGFLRARYAPDVPLTLSASLVIEQSYTPIEGDSASAAELCALLSALAEAPLRQGIAVTGSVNQHGLVQPVGGVNEKVEGFFAACRRVGLTGTQGVIVPRANLDHLMLRQEVVEAVEQGRFRVWAVETIDEALELLSGVPAGARGAGGEFPPGSINQRVEARLLSLARAARDFAAEEEPRPPRALPDELPRAAATRRRP